jgi:DNA-binding NarL/FixJ family response regulator
LLWILIADDHAIFRRGLADILNHSPGISVVADAGNGADAVRLFESTVHADTRRADAIRQIRREFPEALAGHPHHL